MFSFRMFFLAFVLGFAFVSEATFAEDINLQPKYGLQLKNEAQKAADAKFLADVDNLYKGNRKKASEEATARGWQFLRQNSYSDAMRRFNQAWLLDNTNGAALWGMAVLSSIGGRSEESLKLFAEAERFVGSDLNFAVDYALTLGNIATRERNETRVNEAFTRFAHLYERAPQHTMNLQNWAIILYNVGKYSEAWQKIKLAEKTPGGSGLDKRFIAALQEKMPRP
jgi:tetratricopeptide (TPR) repeat protein